MVGSFSVEKLKETVTSTTSKGLPVSSEDAGFFVIPLAAKYCPCTIEDLVISRFQGGYAVYCGLAEKCPEGVVELDLSSPRDQNDSPRERHEGGRSKDVDKMN